MAEMINHDTGRKDNCAICGRVLLPKAVFFFLSKHGIIQKKYFVLKETMPKVALTFGLAAFFVADYNVTICHRGVDPVEWGKTWSDWMN